MSILFDQKVLNGFLLLKFNRFSIYLYHTDFGILFIGEIPYCNKVRRPEAMDTVEKNVHIYTCYQKEARGDTEEEEEGMVEIAQAKGTDQTVANRGGLICWRHPNKW